MAVTISGTDGISKVQDGVIVQADLASGVAGTGPAFAVVSNTATTLTSSVTTKVNYGAVVFDTNSRLSNSRFTPDVAGFYQINAVVHIVAGLSAGSNFIHIFKNGQNSVRGSRVSTSGSDIVGLSVTGLIFCNGTTDFIEIFAFTNGGNGNTENTVSTWSGFLARAA